MASDPATLAVSVFAQPIREQFEAFLDEHRRMLTACLDGLTEEQACRVMPSHRLVVYTGLSGNDFTSPR